MKKIFLNNNLSTELQKAMIATPIPTTYVEYCNMLHGVNNNLESLRAKERREVGLPTATALGQQEM